MKRHRLFPLLSISVIFVLLLSLINAATVFADDETPPPSTEETAQPPEEGTDTETESDPTSTPEADVIEEETSTPEAEETPEPETVEEILDTAPEGVDVVVLDENGEAVALATEEAASIILAGDPMWCPEGVLPGDASCTTAYADFATLLAELTTNSTGTYSGNGTIYVAYDYAASEGLVTIDHDSGDLTNLGDLTIQGGWNFTDNAIDGTTPYSSLNGTWLSIVNWFGDVTVNNIFIDNANDIGLFIETDGDISLSEVTVENSDLDGAVLISNNGNVEVANSVFNYNGVGGYEDSGGTYYEYVGGDGLSVIARSITLNDVYAEGNSNAGAYLHSYAGDVIVSNSVFYDNGFGFGLGAYFVTDIDLLSDPPSVYINGWGGDGLVVDAYGNINLDEVTSEGNAGYGALLIASDGGDVEITSSNFDDNGAIGYYSLWYDFDEDGLGYDAEFGFESEAGDGLIVATFGGGDITLVDVSASANAFNGANLYSDSGNLVITQSVFNDNGWGKGIFELGDSEDFGYLLLEDYLIGDGDYEAFCEFLDEDYIPYESFIFNPCDDEDNSYIEVIAPSFEYNIGSWADEDGFLNYYEIYQEGGQGLEAVAELGTITAEGVVAIGNSADGAHLHGGDDVSLTGGLFAENGSLFAEFNFGECVAYGFYNCSLLNSDPLPGPVESIGAFLEFDYGNGLYVESYDGDITISDVGVYVNGDDGAIIRARDGSVFIEYSEFSCNGCAAPIFIGGDGIFGEYLCDMISLCSEIPLPFNELNFIFSLSEGVDFLYVDGEVDITSGTGLDVYGDSGITLNEVYAYANTGDGTSLFTPASIVITNSEFSGNGVGLNVEGSLELLLGDVEESYIDGEFDLYNGDGIYADAGGDITLSDVVANGNALYGAELYSGAVNSVFIEYSQFNGNGYTGFLGPGIWLSGFIYEDSTTSIGDFDEYYGSGIYVESNGNVTLSYVESNGNYQDGAEVYSNGGQVNVVCGMYNGNGYGSGDGYGIYEDGASSLGLYGPEILGNYYSPYEYYYSNSLALSDECAIPVTEKSTNTTVCVDDQLHLFLVKDDENELNGDFVIFPCPIRDSASVAFVAEDRLPAPLPDFKPEEEGGEAIYRSALRTELTRDDELIDVNEGLILVSFLIPDGVDVETLTILRWNGEEWVELGGVVSDTGPDGLVEEGKLYLKVSTFDLGNFILVSK